MGLLRPGLDDQAVCRKAAALGIAALPLSMCHLEKPKRPGLILGYGGTNARQIEAGVRQLARIL